MSLDTMENKIIIALTPLGLIIGRMAEGIVTSPKVLLIQNVDGAIKIGFKDIIGDPELFFLGSAPYYISENADLNELYFETVTSIKLVKA
jgi:hypothetical protein